MPRVQGIWHRPGILYVRFERILLELCGEKRYYKQIILNRGLPFEVKIPTARPVDISRMNAETLDMELEKGYADMQAGRTKSAAQVFTDIRRDYNVSTTHDLKVMGL